MPKGSLVTKVTVGLPTKLLNKLDQNVMKAGYKDRSHLITEAIRHFLEATKE